VNTILSLKSKKVLSHELLLLPANLSPYLVPEPLKSVELSLRLRGGFTKASLWKKLTQLGILWQRSGAEMKTGQYSMSFTTGTLFHQESVKIAELFLDTQDWKSVREIVLSENLLQARTLNTLKRVYREISSRLKKLHLDELDLLLSGTPQEQKHLLWLAVCRRYQFIADFAKEVLRERYISLKTDVSYEDFDIFFNKKAEWHEELDEIAPATRTKLRQTLFKMLREADLLTVNNMINPAILSARIINAIPQKDKQDILIFPVFESELCAWV
jgi:hypothetical protein